MKKKTLLLTAAAVMLVAAMSIGGMLAYFTDETVEKTNTFSVGDVSITLTETAAETTVNGKTIHAGVETASGFSYTLMPGESYAKVPVVSVDEGSQNAYVKAVVEISNKSGLETAFAGTDVVKPWGLSLVGTGGLVSGGIADYAVNPAVTTWNGMAGTMLTLDDEDYAFITYDADDDTITYTYWFVEPAAAEASFTLFTQVNVPSTFDSAEMEELEGTNVTIKAYAIQSAGFADADAAWAAFDAQQ